MIRHLGFFNKLTFRHALLGLLLVVCPSAGLAQEVSFADIAAGDGAGITYRRTPSASDAAYQTLKERTLVDADHNGVADAPLTVPDILTVPLKSRGAPGVALLDFDRDGDLDIYATNGPGTPNSLYSNQLKETGHLNFIDVALAAGVDATGQDGTGVCFGDIDNDDDPDLLVLGNSEPHRFFENLGNGTFHDITSTSGLGTVSRGASSCSMGDINGDGLLDIVVANTFDMSVQFAIFAEPFAFNQHDVLYRNNGNRTFTDISASSGLLNLAGFPPENAGAAGITWAIAMVDYDLDGDIDIISAEDQAAILPTFYGGVDRGFIHVFQNNGTGHFTDVTVTVGTNHFGAWMGLAFGDWNRDGHMDLFGSNLGDFMWQILPPPFVIGDLSSRWFLGQADGTFTDPGTGDLVVTPFGWGVSSFDYDNDGDTDILYHGGMDFTPGVDLSNPGAVLRNDGNAQFTRDAAALADSTNHTLRVVNGVATGDLDLDGFVDVVSVSNENAPPGTPLQLYPEVTGGPFAAEAFFVDMFVPVGPEQWVWSGLVFDDGTLSVEISSGNDNGGVSVDLLGTKGLTTQGHVNRDGIGAVVFFTPEGGETVMQPVLGGSSHASQHSLTAHFGLGETARGTLEILWPGGVRNRLYKVRADEHVLFPEIPCSFVGPFTNLQAYRTCVRGALDQLVNAGKIAPRDRARFMNSAVEAFRDP